MLCSVLGQPGAALEMPQPLVPLVQDPVGLVPLTRVVHNGGVIVHNVQLLFVFFIRLRQARVRVLLVISPGAC